MIGSAPGCTVDGADQMFMLLAGKEGESGLSSLTSLADATIGLFDRVL